jgi:anti-anti-sigma factor
VLPKFSISSRIRPDVHIVSLKGELDIASADGMADAIVAVDGATVVVDLSGLTFMDSTGISALVVARRRILAEGEGQLVVTRPTQIVRTALEIVGLSAWIVEWSNDWDE